MKKLFLVLLLSISIVSYAFADSNGIWIDASDIRGGTFGSDEPSATSYQFNVPVTFTQNLIYKGVEIDARFVNENQDNSITSNMIVNGAVRSDDIEDETITSSDIGPNAVGSSEVIDNSLTVNDIGPGAVGSSEVIDNSLTIDDIGPDSVGNSELVFAYRTGQAFDARFVNEGQANSISNIMIQGSAVDTNKIADESIRSVDILNGQVMTDDLGVDSVTSGKIAALAVRNEHIANNAVDSSKVAPDSLVQADLAPNSVGNSELIDQPTVDVLFANNRVEAGRVDTNTIRPLSGNRVVIQLS